MNRIFHLLLFLIPCALWGQVKISYPHERQIFQRNNANDATFSVLVNCSEKSTGIQFKLVPLVKGQGTPVEWTNFDSAPLAGFFQGEIKAKGGWYTLWIRTLIGKNNQDSTQLSRVGIGENFIISGQSNTQGTKRRAVEKGALDDRVNCANFFNFLPDYNDNPNHNSIGEQNLDYPFTNFTKMSDDATLGPTGLSPYFWPILGDSLVKKLNVPVCFYNTAWFGTTIKNWLETAKGLNSLNQWTSDTYYTRGFPFLNLKRAVEIFGIKGGVRAILWGQGETDTNFSTTEADYYNQLTELIGILRDKTGVKIPWVIAQSTFTANRYDWGGCTPPTWSPSILRAQKNVVSLSGISELYLGPNTDAIEVPRKNDIFSLCVHFTSDAYAQVANGWLAQLNDEFFRKSTAILPVTFPKLNLICGPNNEILANAESKFSKIAWLNESNVMVGDSYSKQTLNPGNYSVRFKDNLNNEFVIPSFKIASLPIPVTPSIKAMGDTTFCEGKSVTLVGSGSDQFLWNTGEKSASITTSKSDVFKVMAVNAQNCASPFSKTILTKILINPLPPQIKAMSDTLFCEGKSVQLIVSGGFDKYLWNTGETKNTITSTANGVFQALTTNAFGCSSAFSSSIQTKVFANPSSPSITQSSPYYLYGGIKLFDTDFSWELNNTVLSNEKGIYIKLKESGNYAVYASKKYTNGPTCVSPKVNLNYSLPLDGGLTLFPNPSSNVAQIQSVTSLKGADYYLYSNDGRLALQGKIDVEGAFGIKLDGLSPGMYKLTVKTSSQVYQRNLVISY